MLLITCQIKNSTHGPSSLKMKPYKKMLGDRFWLGVYVATGFSDSDYIFWVAVQLSIQLHLIESWQFRFLALANYYSLGGFPIVAARPCLHQSNDDQSKPESHHSCQGQGDRTPCHYPSTSGCSQGPRNTCTNPVHRELQSLGTVNASSQCGDAWAYFPTHDPWHPVEYELSYGQQLGNIYVDECVHVINILGYVIRK